MGDAWRDFGELNWGTLIPESERSETFVFLDDHQSSIQRVAECKKWGFQHLFYDDNYPSFPGTPDCYSFNALCAPLPINMPYVPFKSNTRKDGGILKNISIFQHSTNLAYFLRNMEVYFEFPA